MEQLKDFEDQIAESLKSINRVYGFNMAYGIICQTKRVMDNVIDAAQAKRVADTFLNGDGDGKSKV